MPDSPPHETGPASGQSAAGADRAGLAERHWTPPATPPLLDGAFLAPKYDEHDRLARFRLAWQTSDLRTSAEAMQARRLLLLGPPGMGKTTELGRMAAAVAGPSHVVRLAEVTAPADVERLLRAAPVHEWKTGGTLFLDAFDEGHADVRPLAITLAQALVDLDPDRTLSLRITCRDADRPRSLEDALQAHYGDLTVLSLAPLLRADAWTIAALTLGDEEANGFMAAVARSTAEPLAAVPLTLTQLVEVYSTRGDLPESRSALFREAVLLLAEETNPGRYEAGRTGMLDASQRVRLAARVAALLRFSGRTHLHLGPTSSVAPDALTAADVEGDKRDGTAWAGPVPVSVALRDLALHSGLFVGDGRRFRFVHLAYEEFLATEHLVAEGAPPESAFALLSHPGTGVRPQLRETAAVLAGSDARFRDALLLTDPGVALRYGAAGLGDGAREKAVESFLEAHERGVVDFWDRLPNATTLAHPGLADQLARWALDSTRRHAARKAALSAGADAGCTALTPTAVSLALNRREESALRHLAVLVALRLDPDTAHGPLACLADPGDDEDDGDRYLAFAIRRALFPDRLPVARLTTLLASDDVRGGSQGASARSAADGFAQDIVNVDLPDSVLLEALDWVAHQENLGRSSQPFADAVVEVAAARSPERPAVALALARALLGPGRKAHYSPPFEWPGDALRGDVARADAVRHAVAAAAVMVLAERDPYPDGWDERMGRLEHGLGLLRSDDTPWILDCLRAEPSATGRRAWVGALSQTFYPGPHTDAVLSVCLAVPIVLELFPLYVQYFAAIETDGTVADHERAREAKATKARASQQRREAAARPNPPTSVQIDRALARTRSGDLKEWPKLAGALTLHPVDKRWFRQPFHDDIEQAATWDILSAEQRDAVAHEAEAFLCTVSKTADGGDSLSVAAAFRLLREHAPERLDALGDDVWHVHAHALVEAPFNSTATTSVDRRADLLERAYRSAPVDVTEALARVVAAEDAKPEGGTPTVLFAARRFWDGPLRAAIVEAVRALPVAPDGPWGTRERVLEMLLDSSVPEVVEVVVSQLQSDVLAGTLRAGTTAVWYAVRAFLAAPVEAWALLSGPISTDDALAEAFLRRYSIYTRRNPETDANPAALADLYLRLYTVCPASEDPERPDGVIKWDTDHGLRGLRDNLLSAITRQGTADAVAAVERLARDGPLGTDFLYSLRNAREEWARRDPAFLSPANVLRTAREPDAAPIRSDADLQAAALRALARLQQELTGQEQASSPDLWNTTDSRVRPKIEVEISDYVARYLQRALGGRGVSVVREAEVYAGSETDLHLSVPLDGGRHALLVVEVKGAWEAGAVTGLRRQLAHRYLAQAGRRHGVHLVASFERTLWDVGDWRREKRPDPTTLLTRLADEVALAAADGYDIVPVVLRIRPHRNPPSDVVRDKRSPGLSSH